MQRGKLLAFEGPGVSDKDGRIERIREKSPIKSFLVRDPWGDSFAELVQELPAWMRANPSREPAWDSFPFFKARAEYVKSVIEPRLEEGVSVFASPYAASAYASLIAGDGRRELGSAFVSICASLPRALKPDAYIVLNMPPGTMHSRMKLCAEDALARGEELEVRPHKYYEGVRDGLLRFGRHARETEKSQLVVISAEKDPLYIEENLRHWIGDVLGVEQAATA
jgi:thymidylate kinase